MKKKPFRIINKKTGETERTFCHPDKALSWLTTYIIESEWENYRFERNL